MAEYISREDILDIASQYCADDDGSCSKADVDLREMLDEIEALPAADVHPVRRGRWIETHISLCKWIPEDEKEEGHNFYMAEMKCSCCERYNTKTFSLTLEKPDFCQHCGARMIKDGEQNE